MVVLDAVTIRYPELAILTWREVAGKWGLPMVSLCGYTFLFLGVMTFPGMAYTTGREGALASATLVEAGAVIVGGATLAATVAKVVDAAKTACFHGIQETKATFSQAFRVGGFVRRTLFPPPSQMVKEVMDTVRNPTS